MFIIWPRASLYCLKINEERELSYHSGTSKQKNAQAEFERKCELARSEAERKEWLKKNAKRLEAMRRRDEARRLKEQREQEEREARRVAAWKAEQKEKRERIEAAEEIWRKTGNLPDTIDDYEEDVGVLIMPMLTDYAHMNYLYNMPRRQTLKCITHDGKKGTCDSKHQDRGRCVCVPKK